MGKEIIHIGEPTLLPTPVANLVSLVTRSSSLYLQLGSFIGGLAISGARITTLTGLEISRALIEGILHRAGKDVSERSTGEIGRAEADGMLERSIATLHSTITSISFAASTGFHLSSTILDTAGDLSQQLLAALDSILGSTDSSRAIASIITLIRREFQNPATGQEGEKVGVGDLLVGICGLALLQRWCRKITDAESRQGRYEEVVWDVVILDDGRRADVVADGTQNLKTLGRANSMSFVTPGGNKVVQTIEREGRVLDESDDDLPEIDLKQKIMKSLPADSSVSIRTETTTTKTITVDITGAQPSALLSPPPGVEIVETNVLNGNSDCVIDDRDMGLLGPKYRVVYRVVHHKTRGTKIEPTSSLEGAEEAIEVSDNEEAPSPISKDDPNQLLDLAKARIKLPDKDLSSTLTNTRNSSAGSVKSIGSSHSAESVDNKPTGLPIIPTPKAHENVANQKRSRKPRSSSSSINGVDPPPQKKAALIKPTPTSRAKPERPPVKSLDKKGSFRNALKKGSSSALSHMWSKESSPDSSTSKPVASKPAWVVVSAAKSNIPVPQRNSSITPQREAPRPPQRGNPNYFSSRDLGLMQPAEIPRSQSRTSYYSVHEQRRDSMVSQTDTYSIHSTENRPGSPTAFRAHLKAQSSMLRVRSEKSMSSQHPTSPVKHHRRSQSYVPSIYTLKTNNSAQSLLLAQPKRSAFEDSQTMERLAHTGFIDGLFPNHHIVRNTSRFVRFASASYGSHFLRVMGITPPRTGAKSTAAKGIDTNHHHEHHSFSTHTQLPPDTILLSSFVDPQGGTDSTGQTNTGVPMVHFVSLDHESKAVVLTCRGTLGFEDVLTDMTCDYDELTYRGKGYKVHKGIHASARRLLEGGGGRVMATIAASLEEFSDYGLVLCGHSLGGGVTALLAILISEPSPDPSSSAFFTSFNPSPQLLLPSASEEGITPTCINLPAGRPIHVYAYGPPATLSPSLRLATRGLITTIVNNQDLVPFLSLGVLHDLQAVALAFKTDDSGAKGEFRKRVIAGVAGTFRDKWYANGTGGMSMDETEDDQWAYSALKVLRASMLSTKLLPPGEVFIVEAMPVLQRDAFIRHGAGGKGGERGLGRPATRSVLKYVRDVEKRFGEIQFGGSMLLDHSPGRYEANLRALARGVLS